MRRYIAIPVDPAREGHADGTKDRWAVKDRWTGRLVLRGPYDAQEAQRLADAKELLGSEAIDGAAGGIPG